MKKKEDRLVICYCLAAAAILLTVCSRSSFLYVFNNWDDANSYMTVGKSIFRGLVPYRDLFDQKGILLYFFYGLASLVSATDFHAVWVLEVIAAAASLCAVHRILTLYLKTRVMPVVLTPLIGAVIYSSRCFYRGGSAEEFLFPFLLWGMFLSFRYFRRTYPAAISYRTVLTGGILAGCVFHIKFSSLGLFFAWMAVVFFALLIGARDPRRAFASCLVFLAGMGIATLPWLIYFGVNHAVADWFHVYIYRNVFEYGKTLALGERIHLIYRTLIDHALNNRPAAMLLLFGFFYLFVCTVITVLRRGKGENGLLGLSIPEFLNAAMQVLFLTLVIFFGGVSLPYYSFPITAFAVTGGIAAGNLIEWITERFRSKSPAAPEKKGKKDRKWVGIAGFGAAALAASALYALSVSGNPSFRQVRAEDFWLFRFRDHITASGVQDPHLINVGCFDAGLYTVTDSVPVCYYFQTQTLGMEEVHHEQKECIRQGIPDFILSRDEEYPYSDGYRLVLTEEARLPDEQHIYYLYQKME